MWLLDTNTLALRKIADNGWETTQGSMAPRLQYGILSHRWEDSSEEPTFEEIRNQKAISGTKGGDKLRECCRVAQSDGLELLWSDTCE